MKPFRPLLLAGLLTAGVTALAGYAYAGQDGLKTLILQLPGGSVQQIQFAAPPPQQLVLLPQAMPMPAAMPTALVAPDPFARMDRISAIMDAQAAAMMSALNVVMSQGLPGAAPGPGGLLPAAVFGPLQPGASASYAFISASSANPHGACMESVQITAAGPGQAPKVVSRRAGDCTLGSPFLTRPTEAVGPQAPVSPAPAPHLIRARAELPRLAPHPSQS